MSGTLTDTAITSFVSGIQATTEALRNTCNDPADAVRLLSALVEDPSITPPAGPPQTALSTVSVLTGAGAIAAATAALCRRAALTSLARACADYQPSSYDDALTVRAAVTGLFDEEITVAANAGEGSVYAQLRTLRTAVETDLETRGSMLATLRTIDLAAPAPALVLAYTLYSDPSRADELLARSGAAHAGFLSGSFEVLSS